MGPSCGPFGTGRVGGRDQGILREFIPLSVQASPAEGVGVHKAGKLDIDPIVLNTRNPG